MSTKGESEKPLSSSRFRRNSTGKRKSLRLVRSGLNEENRKHVRGTLSLQAAAHLNYLECSQGSTPSLALEPCNECVFPFSRSSNCPSLPLLPHSTYLTPIYPKGLSPHASFSGKLSLPLTTQIWGNITPAHISITIHTHPHIAIAIAYLLG